MTRSSVTTNRLIGLAVLFLLVIFYSFLPVPGQAHLDDEGAHKVLVLHSYHPGFTWTDFIEAGIESVFADTDLNVERHVEYMDTKRYDTAAVFPRLVELYESKYKNEDFHVIITTDDNAFDFILAYRDQLFPGVPVVFSGVNNFKDERLRGHTQITGVAEDFDLRGTTDIILRLHPQTRHIAVISDTSPSGALNLERMRAIMPDYEDRVDFTELYQLTADELAEALQNLPPDTVVLNLSFWRDPTGRAFNHQESISLIVDNSDAPVYTPWDHMIVHGTIGGMATNGRLQGQYAAEMAMRILHGESANDIPIIYQSPNTPMFDYPAMARFGISVSDLPADSIVMNEPETFYYRYKYLIWLTTFFVVFQTLAIVLLIVNIVRRRRSETEVHHRNRELALFNRIIAASATSTDSKSILQTACREMALAFDVPHASATLINEDKASASIVADYHVEDTPTLLGQKFSLDGNPLVEHLVATQKPIAAFNVQEDDRLAPIHALMQRRRTMAALVLPLILENNVIGTLNLGTTRPRTFSPAEINLAQSVVDQVTGALARVRLEQENRRLEEQHRQGQKMEAIGRLAGGLAHDFNNLLTVITGYSELLLHRHIDKGTAQYKEVEQIKKAGERATGLTRQLLAFSRQQVIQPEVLDLNIIITDMNKMLRRLVSENIELTTELDPGLGQIEADRGQIEQVIMNLVVNGCDAMPHGGRLITKTANTTLDEAHADRHIGLKPGPYVMLTISDTGMGMDEEIQSRIFEPFFTTKEKGKGTGLGLATVYGIVRQNDGYITVSSRPQKGTTFHVFLPRLAKPQPVSRPGPEMVESSYGTETILLVEDEEMVRDLARYALRQNGYRVLEAHHGPDALKFSRQYQEPIHLLLTDVVMPGGLSGPDLARQISAEHPGIKVLYMSGYVDNEIVQEGVLNADVAFLQKPFSPANLSRRVRDVLDDG